DQLVAYVLIDPCDPPRQIQLEFYAPVDGDEHRAFWGEDLIGSGTPGTAGRVNMGALPPAGQWVRLQVPASTLNLAGKLVLGMYFEHYNGHAWWDRVATTAAGAAAANASLSVNPATVVGGNPATGTVLLTNAAAASATVSLSSATPSLASVPASVTVPAGKTSADFTVTTTAVASSTPVVLTSTLSGVAKNATVTVVPPPALVSLSAAPSAVVHGG